MYDYAVQIDNLKKSYNKNNRSMIALNNLSLNIKPGSFFGLIGPNGAGKSTTIGIISGLINKDSGSISVCGHNLDEDTLQAKSMLGVVPQELVFDPFLNVKNTIDIYAGYYGVPKRERRTKEIIDKLGLTDKINAYPRALSGGMKRRLLIAKATVHNPRVLILDEPTAGLDLESRYKLWEFIKEINDNGTTILLTTHYMEEIQKLCTDIAVINYGQIVIRGPKEKIINRFKKHRIELLTTTRLSVLPKSLESFEAHIDANKIVIATDSAKLPEIIMLCQQQEKLEIKDVIIRESSIDDIVTTLFAQ